MKPILRLVTVLFALCFVLIFMKQCQAETTTLTSNPNIDRMLRELVNPAPTYTKVEYWVDGQLYVREVENYRIDLIRKKAEEKGLMASDILAMCIKESFNCSDHPVGDRGKAHGAFQIHLGFHKHITPKQARNFDFALEWTTNRLLAKKYATDRAYAIMKHNGSNARAKEYSRTVLVASDQLDKYFN